jgi:hypothetical protein
MRTVKIGLALAIVTFVIAAARAADPPPLPPPAPSERVMFHGHPMMLHVDGGKVEIRFAEPPAALLLSGQWNGPELVATAYLFAGRCGAVPFAVVGGVDPYGNLVVHGQAPVILQATCRQLGLEWNDNSLLTFTRPPE